MAAIPTTQTGSTIQLSTTVSPFRTPGSPGPSSPIADTWGSCKINGIQYVCPVDGYFAIKGAERAYRWDIQDGMLLQGAIEFLRGVTPSQFTLEYTFWADEHYETYLEIAQNFQYNFSKILAANAGLGSQAKQTAAQLAAIAQQDFTIANAAANNPNIPPAQKLQLEAKAQSSAEAAREAGATSAQTANPGRLQVRAIQIYHPALDIVGITQVICESVGAPEQVSDDHMWRATFKLREYFPPIQLPPQDKDTAPQEPGNPLSPDLQNPANEISQLTNTANGILDGYKTL
jgi:hypothetical protein